MKKLLTLLAAIMLSTATMMAQTETDKNLFSYQGSVSLNGYYYGAPGGSLHTSHGIRYSNLYAGISAEHIITIVPITNLCAHIKLYFPNKQGWQGFISMEVGGSVNDTKIEPGVALTPSFGFLYSFKNDMAIEFGPCFSWLLSNKTPLIGTSLTFSF